MPAEIALLNRAALAFAADSAATIRVGASQKIYDSAEKLFEFSRRQPIGLMIYNNVEYVDVPLDVIIRKHRSECNKRFSAICNAADEFLEYLEKFDHTVEDEKKYLLSVLVSNFSKLQSDLTTRFRASSAKGKLRTFNFEREYLRLVSEAHEEYTASALSEFLSDISFEEFDRVFGVVSETAARYALKYIPPAQEILQELRRYSFAIVKSSIGSEAFTGLVFGGFAKDDLFPTLCYRVIDGVYFNNLKVLLRAQADIEKNDDKAQMVAFAQTEMADRFIFGIDDDFQSKIGTYVQQAIDEVMKLKPRSFTVAQRNSIKAAVMENFKGMVDKLKQEEHNDILDIVNFMSKKELAEMAHALVELTSKKRRFSKEQETVGGPIDVAIITRNEGFIWIRRKHYFDSELNQGYFARVFGQGKEGEDDKAKGAPPPDPGAA